MAKATQGQGHGRDQGQLRIAVFDIAAPQRFQMLRFERGWLDVALGGKGGPLFVPAFAARGAVQMAGRVGVDLDLAAVAV